MDLLLRNFDYVMTFIINERIDDDKKNKQKKAGVNLLLTKPKARKKGSGKTFILILKKELTREPG